MSGEVRIVCATCGVYSREGLNDGFNSYTVCTYCGSSGLRFIDDKPKRPPLAAVRPEA